MQSSAGTPPPVTGEWQAHAGAVGFGGLNAVTEPLKEFPVKGFFLLEMPSNDLARKWFTERKVKLEPRFAAVGAKHLKVWKAELWDPVAVARCIVQGMNQEGLETLHFNVSAGPNTVSVGATLAAMYWDVRLYYANVDYTDTKAANEVDGRRVTGATRLPPFRAQPPREESLRALSILVGQEKEIQSGAWKQLLTAGHGIIHHKGDGNRDRPMKPQAVHGQFEALVRPLLDLGLINESWKFGQRSYRPTEQGQAFARLFEGLPRSESRKVDAHAR